MRPEQLKILEELANGIIPADEMDGGAACVGAGRIIVERIEKGVNAKVYLAGLEFVESLKRDVIRMSEGEIHELLGVIREKLPGFFKQLRMDVSSLYLSDEGVWERIGFPGASSESGGYPDFAEKQSRTQITQMTQIVLERGI